MNPNDMLVRTLARAAVEAGVARVAPDEEMLLASFGVIVRARDWRALGVVAGTFAYGPHVRCLRVLGGGLRHPSSCDRAPDAA
jgi:hypothetical protein